MSDEQETQLEANEILLARESLMMNVTEDILVAMEDQNISKADLSRLLGTSKAFITQILGGSRNMTLRTLSDIAFAIDAEVTVTFTPKKKNVGNDFKRESSNVVALARKKPVAATFEDAKIKA